MFCYVLLQVLLYQLKKREVPKLRTTLLIQNVVTQAVWIFLVLSVSSIASMLRLGILSAEAGVLNPHSYSVLTKIRQKITLYRASHKTRKHQPEDARVVVRLLG